jgi:phage-related protein
MSSQLLQGESLVSPNELLAPSGHYRLQMQNDGNLVLYDRFDVARWATNTDGNGPSTLVHQLDSNVVIYRNSDNQVTYSTATYVGGGINNPSGRNSYALSLQDDGNLVLYTEAGQAIWASDTNTPANIPSVKITSELQKPAPGAVIELFELELNTAQHDTNNIYRFHAGTNLSNDGEVVWNGNNYLRFPVEADGFEYSGNGQLPRPRIRISNILSTITAELLTLPDGLEGAKFTRIRTLGRYLDAANFPATDTLLTEDGFDLLYEDGSSIYLEAINPTEDPTAEFPREIYYIDRKVIENRDVVEFEMCAAFDLAGVRAPKRQCIANVCQWVYKSAECGYTGGLPTCDKTLDACKAHFGDNAELPFGSFPGIGAYTV